MPLDEKCVFNDAVIVQFYAKTRSKLLLFGVAVDEELNDGLE